MRRKLMRAKQSELEMRFNTLDGLARHLDTVRRRLWDAEGQLLMAKSLEGGEHTVDDLTRRRLDYKVAIKAAQQTLDRTSAPYATSKAKLAAAREDECCFRGSLEEIERATLTSETLTIMFAGQAELLRRRLQGAQVYVGQCEKEASAAVRDHLEARKTQVRVGC